MFNKYNNMQSVSNHVNAVSGQITKTYKDSYFKKFHLTSQLANNLFEKNTKLNANPVVIQMVICGDMEVIAELIDREKYNEMFEDKLS